MRHRDDSAMARRAPRKAPRAPRRVPRPAAPPAASGRHRAQPVPGYPWLRTAGTVGLATLVPVTGAWVAVGDVSVHLNRPSTAHIAGSALPAGTPDRAQPTAAATLVLSRSPSPSLDAVARSGQRTAAHAERMTPRVTVPPSSGTEPSARHRADRAPEASPAPAAAGRHRADTEEDRSTTPHRGGNREEGRQTGADGGDSGGGSNGRRTSERSDRGHAYGHDRGGSDPNGHGSGRDRSEADSQDNSHEADPDQGSGANGGQGNGHAHGDSQGQPESHGNGGQGNGRGHAD